MEIKYVYHKGIKQDFKKEKLIEKVITICSNELSLPDFIIIEFCNLLENTYGETVLDSRNKNRVRLKSNLQYNETVYVLTHEIIHLSQIHTGILSYSKSGDYLWNGVKFCNCLELGSLSYNDYKNLPWELDVVKKQQKLLENLLKN